MAELQDIKKQLEDNKAANTRDIHDLKSTFDKHFLALKRSMLDSLEDRIEGKGKSGPPAGAGGNMAKSGGNFDWSMLGTLPGAVGGILAGITAIAGAAAGLRGWEKGAVTKLTKMFSKEGSIGKLFSNAFDSIRDTMRRRVGMVKDIWGKDPKLSLSARIKNWYQTSIVARIRRLLGMDFAEAADDGKKLNFRQQVVKFFSDLRSSISRNLGLTMDVPEGEKMTFAQRVRNFFGNLRNTISRNLGLTMSNVDQKTGKFTKFTFAQRVRNFFNLERGKLAKMFGIDDAALKAGGAGDDVSKMSLMQRIRQAFNNRFTKLLAMFGLDAADYAKVTDAMEGGEASKGTKGGLLGRIKSVFKSVMSPITKLIDGVTGFFKGAVGGPIMKAMKPFISGAKSFFSVLGRVFKPIGVIFSLFEGFKAYQDEEGGVFAKLRAGVAAAISDFFGAPFDLLTSIVAWVMSKLGFSDSAQAIKDWQKRTGGFSGMLNDLLRSVLGLGGKTFDWFMGLFPSMDDIKKQAKALLPNFKFDFANPLPLIGGKIADMMDSMAKWMDDSYFPGSDTIAGWAYDMAKSIRNGWGKPSPTQKPKVSKLIGAQSATASSSSKNTDPIAQRTGGGDISVVSGDTVTDQSSVQHVYVDDSSTEPSFMNGLQPGLMPT